MRKQITTSEIFKKMDDRVEHLAKLDKIRAERSKLNASSFASKMKDKNKIGENSQ